MLMQRSVPSIALDDQRQQVGRCQIMASRFSFSGKLSEPAETLCVLFREMEKEMPFME